MLPQPTAPEPTEPDPSVRLPADNRGRPRSPETGRPLVGAAAEAARNAAERRAAADAVRQQTMLQVESLAALCVDLAGGTDQLRLRLGRDRALALLKLAGKDTRAIADRWAEQAPNVVTPQVSRAYGDDYSRDPSHAPAVVEAILRGESNEEVSRLMQEAAAELAQRPRPKIGPGHHPEGDQGPQLLGVKYQTIGGARRPVQTSYGKPWEQFEDHQPEGYARLESQLKGQPVAPQDTPPARAQTWTGTDTTYWQPPECDHQGETGKHCSQCGAALRQLEESTQ